MNAWQLPALLSALIAVVIAVVTAVVGLWQIRRVTHERLGETIDEYAQSNKAKDIRIDDLEKAGSRQDMKIMSLSKRIGQLEGRQQYILQDKVLLERYCGQLRTLLLRAGQTVPPRPQVEILEENGGN